MAAEAEDVPPPPAPVVEEEPEPVHAAAVEEETAGYEDELDEVLDLTEPLPEEPMAALEPEPEPEPEPEIAAEPEVELEPEYEPEPIPEIDEEPEYDPEEDIAFGEPVMSAQPTPAPAPAAPAAGTLLSNEAANAASAAFGALASNLFTSAGGSRTLEDLVADLLRPMLKEWLDHNLPPLVEQLVREEIERVARRGR